MDPKEQYVENKNMYEYLTIGTNGGSFSKKSKWVLIDEKKRKHIMKNYNIITESSKPCTSFPIKTIMSATSGGIIQGEKTKNALCARIEKIKNEGEDPIICEDSLTAWADQGVEKFGLTVGDIMKMKFGEKMEVILMDRNSGENIPGEKGSKFMPTVYGFSVATYIHGQDLTGILKFDNIGVIHTPFIWEINLAAVGGNYFWGPLEGCECGNNFDSGVNIEANKLNPKILVGWRGPSIRMDDAKKYLPRYAVKYDNWWNDYVVNKYYDYLHKKNKKW
jgi:hypothetical protein